MKKYLFYFVALFAFVLTACSNDNESESEKVSQKLTSTIWYRTSAKGSKTSSNFKYIKFTSDGKCYYNSYYSKSTDLEKYYCIWTYNEETNMLRIYREDGYYTFNFSLEMESNGDWIGTDNTTSTTTVWIYTPYKESEDK